VRIVACAALAAVTASACGRISFDPLAAVSGDALRDTAGGSGSGSATFVAMTMPAFVSASQLGFPISAKAGDLLVVAVTWNDMPASVSIQSDFFVTWVELGRADIADPTPCDPAPPGPGTDADLFWTTLASDVSGTITITQSQGTNPLGAYAAEYSGIDRANPYDVKASAIATSASNAMTAGTLATTGADLVVAAFVDTNNLGTMVPGSGWTERGSDMMFYSMFVDNAPGAPAGSITPTGTLPTIVSDECWVGVSAAFRL
jgi:hypothetical protein